jgi:tetratricopeptide (TPR) repeat protein
MMRPDLDLAAIGSYAVENVSTPTPATPSGSPPRAAHGLFVGRGREFAELSSALDALRGGRGGLYLLSGEPGIGKTRLAERVGEAASNAGILVLWGRCWESGGALTYWPWVQVLRAGLRGRDPATLVQAGGRVVGHLGQLLPELAPALPASAWIPDLPLDTPAGARVVLFDAVCTLLATLAAEQPILVVLDDLHAADESSLLLLQYLARELQQSPVLLLATHRDWEMHRVPARRRLLGGLARASQHLPLRGLGEPEVARFMQVADRDIPPASSLVAAVHRTTGGNPFFLQEVVRVLQARGVFETTGAPGGEAFGVPLRVRETVRRRLELLSAGCGAMLPVAAVVGQEFDRFLLAQACGIPTERLPELLDEAIRAGVLVHLGGHRYGFSHGIIREALCESIAPGERAQLHARVGEVLESRSPTDPDAYLGELAHHFGEAAQGGADPAKAVTYARRAAQQALERLAFEEAVSRFQHALGALDLDPHGDLGSRGELLLSLGEAQRQAGKADAARDTFAHAAAVARRLGSADMLARAGLGFGGIGRERVATDHDWIALLEEALAALGDGDSPLRARVLACLAMALYWSDGPERRDALSRDAVAMARRLGDTAALAFALDFRLKALWGPGGVDERLATAGEILGLAQKSRDRRLELEARRWNVVSLLELGDVVAADREIAAVTHIADELRDPLFRWQSLVWRGMRAAIEGDFARAEALAGEAHAAGERVQSHTATPVYLGQVFGIRWHQGRLGELTEMIRAVIQGGSNFPPLHCGLAQCAMQGGDLELARRELDFLSAGRFAALPHDASRLSTLVSLAEVVGRVGAFDHATSLYEELLPYARLTVVVGPGLGYFGAVARHLGLLAAGAGRLADAERHFAAALELDGRMGARAWVAWTQGDFAALLLRRGEPGDAERAAELRAAALRTAEALDMPLLKGHLRTLVAPRAPSPGRQATAASPCRFVHEGDFWTVSFDGATSRIRDAKGMRYLRLLLGNPGQEFHVLALVADVEGRRGGAPGTSRMSDAALERLGMHHTAAGDAGLVLDAQARAAYRARMGELEVEQEEAEAANDIGRRDRAAAEIEFLERELANAVGLGGRGRRAGSPAERARLSVTRAVRAAIARMATANPSLGNHLDSTLHTGTFCSYAPDPRVPTTWQV